MAHTSVFVFTEEEYDILVPPMTPEYQSPSRNAEEVANSLLHLGRVPATGSDINAPTEAAPQLVAMETEENVTVAVEHDEKVEEEQDRETDDAVEGLNWCFAFL